MVEKSLPKILVIDDERGPRESLRILLKDDYTVYCADHVDRGVEILKEESPEVIILDIRMPDKSGIDGLSEIREIDPLVSVIMLTGYGALETAQKALRLGANDYMKKPFDAREMMEKIANNVQRTRVEKKRHRTETRLFDLNKTLINELREMEHMASLGQASAEFVHDLRNPLTVVLGYVELLSDQLEGMKGLGGEYNDIARYLDVVEANVQHCRELANTWQERGKSGITPKEAVEIAEILEEMRGGIDLLAKQERTNVEYCTSLRGAKVMASRSQISRALHNVVTNALHAVPNSGGEVRIVSRQTDEYVEIEVHDNGHGIPPEHLNRIFEPYFTTKRNDKGTGLGLAITKKIVEDCQGNLCVNSKPGEGTVVSLSLPIICEEKTAESRG